MSTEMAVPLTFEQRMSLMDPNWAQKRTAVADAAKQDLARSAVRTLIVGGIVGVVAGTVGGALLWKSHRVAGALIGGLLVGPTCGYGIGALFAMRKAGK